MIPIAFVQPWILMALAGLPLLWWLLRATPPAPLRVAFPALRLLHDLRRTEETPARTPWWLVLLRAFLAILLIAAAAGPVWRAESPLQGGGPLVLVVDDGWAAARNWPARQTALADLTAQAEREGRAIVLLTTAPGSARPLSGLLTPAQARERIAELQPKPWPTDRKAALAALADIKPIDAGAIVWLSDSIEDGGAAALAERLQSLGHVRLIEDSPTAAARILLPPISEAGAMRVEARRLAANDSETIWLRARDGHGRLLAREALTFAAGSRRAEVSLGMPVEVRNQIERLELEGEDSAAVTVLLDERWRRRSVGLIAGRPTEGVQPLLGELYYLEHALAASADIRHGTLETLMRQPPTALILADIGGLGTAEQDNLDRWIRSGGVLLRFAGPALAAAPDGLLPVTLRATTRSLGGALSWAQPAQLAPFPPDGPFAGLEPTLDVNVTRQVLARPGPGLAARTWARLGDGTPLVTAERRDDGWLVLFHVTANAAWSDLPLSGLFVEMLRRVVALGDGFGSDNRVPLPPRDLLDGFGRIAAPSLTATPIAAGQFAETRAGPAHPPGYYGTEAAQRALNLSASLSDPTPLGLPQGIERVRYQQSAAVDLTTILLTTALLIGLADILVALALRGLLPARRRWQAAGALVGMVILLEPFTGHAQEAVPPAALETRLAYVRTGDAREDAVSRAGLEGLSAVLHRRTAIEPGVPDAINVETDELAFYPLLYWRITASQAPPSPDAIARLNDYLRFGGLILFDQAGKHPGGGGSRDAESDLRRLAGGLTIPALIRVPDDHVLTRSFYLLRDFPGRWRGRPVWVERLETGVNDGVSSVVIGSHDWAAAWAVDDRGRPLFATVPGGEEQREHAYRFGVNLVMYALAGNYKADQVHVPLIMRRLGL